MRMPRLLLALMIGLSLTMPALADPGGKGQGRGGGNQGQGGQGQGNQGQGNQGQGGQGQGNQGGGSQGHPNQGQGIQGSAAFSTQERSAISAYYGSMIQSGNCPPGLAKKGNGCQPPGQAKKWNLGQPLPAGLLTYPLPAQLLMQLNPPAGYRYVQVGTDVLMLAIGTNMVVTALQGIIR